MSDSKNTLITRRLFASTALAAPFLGRSAFAQTNEILETTDTALETEILEEEAVKRNISNFKSKSWEPFFKNTRNGAILVDTRSRALHYWSADQSIYRLYPTSVPASPELTRLGRTTIIRKRVGPDWRPTANMLKRNPEWPKHIPAGPDNPLGTHALYLSWQYYRIHGTHDTRKIGRRSSNGCIGLYNHDISTLFDLVKVGTQVLLI